MSKEKPAVKGLRERLKDGEHIICAEGYLIEFERRCYVASGAFAPEVVLDNPERVIALSEEFVHAGSDVVEAYTYYGHRAKMKIIGREDEVETLNRRALQIARKVADQTGTLMAGNLSNTNMYTPGNDEINQKVIDIFKEQIEWAVDEGADYIIGETFMDYGEAKLALDCVQKYGCGIPAVITIMAFPNEKMQDGYDVVESCRLLEEAGADVVGLNCARGPDSILPVIKKVRAACKGPLACIPVPYRTDMSQPCYQDLRDQKTGRMSFPDDMDSWLCARSHITEFTNQIKDMVQYLGLCCGNRSHYTRAMAMAIGRDPAGAKYKPDWTKNIMNTTDKEYAYCRETWAKGSMYKDQRPDGLKPSST